MSAPPGEHLPQAAVFGSTHSWSSEGYGGLDAEFFREPLVHALRETEAFPRTGHLDDERAPQDDAREEEEQATRATHID